MCFVDHCLSFCPFSFGDCIVYPSSTCGFSLPIWLFTTHLTFHYPFDFSLPIWLFTTHLTFHYPFGFFKFIKILHYFTLLLFFFIYFHHFFFSLWTIQDEKYCTLRTTFNLFLLQFYYRLCIFRAILVKNKGKYDSLHCYCVMTLWPLLCFILFINLASKTVMIIMKLIEIVVIYCICLQRYKMYIF
jgi:hypothetical protein